MRVHVCSPIGIMWYFAVYFALCNVEEHEKNKLPYFFQRYNAYKYHWSENRVPTILEVNQGSLDQRDPHTNRLLCSYDYKDMEGLAIVSDYPGGVAVIHGGFSRLVSVRLSGGKGVGGCDDTWGIQ